MEENSDRTDVGMDAVPTVTQSEKKDRKGPVSMEIF